MLIIAGPPIISSLYLRHTGVLCQSTGQLVDQVQWLLNGRMITHFDTQFVQYHKLVDRRRASYHHWLLASSKYLQHGDITCKLTDESGRTSQRTIKLPGLFINLFLRKKERR